MVKIGNMAFSGVQQRMSQEKGDDMKKGEGVEGIHRGQDIVKLDGWGYADSGTKFSQSLERVLFFLRSVSIGLISMINGLMGAAI